MLVHVVVLTGEVHCPQNETYGSKGYKIWPAKDEDEIPFVRVVFYTANIVHKTGKALDHVSFTCFAKNSSPSWKVLFPVLRISLAQDVVTRIFIVTQYY